MLFTAVCYSRYVRGDIVLFAAVYFRPSICPESSGTVPNFYLYICPVTDTPKSLDCPGNSSNEVAREK